MCLPFQSHLSAAHRHLNRDQTLEDAVKAGRLLTFNDMLAALQDEKPSSTFAGLDVCLTPAQADIICGQQSQSKEDSAAAEKRLRVAGILRLPSAVDKKKSEKKKSTCNKCYWLKPLRPKGLECARTYRAVTTACKEES